MTTKKDAAELLYYFYKMPLNNQPLLAENLLKETKWGSWRLEKAIRFLREANAINITIFKEKIERLQKFVVVRLTPTGVQTIEDKDQFKATFGFELNLNLKKWSWQISK